MFGGKILSDLIGVVPATKRIYQPGLESLLSGNNRAIPYGMDMGLPSIYKDSYISMPVRGDGLGLGTGTYDFGGGFNTVLPDRKYDDLTLSDIMQGVIQAPPKESYDDRSLRTSARPKAPIVNKPIAELYEELEDYQDPDYFNYVRNNQDLRSLFESSDAAKALAEAAWDGSTGAIDPDKFDGEAYRDAAIEFGKSQYDKDPNAYDMPMIDRQRYVTKERMVDNFVEGERPDREILTQGAARNILDRLYQSPRETRSYNPLSFDDYRQSQRAAKRGVLDFGLTGLFRERDDPYGGFGDFGLGYGTPNYGGMGSLFGPNPGYQRQNQGYGNPYPSPYQYNQYRAPMPYSPYPSAPYAPQYGGYQPPPYSYQQPYPYQQPYQPPSYQQQPYQPIQQFQPPQAQMAPPMQPPAPTEPPRYTSGPSSLSQLFEGLKSLGTNKSKNQNTGGLPQGYSYEAPKDRMYSMDMPKNGGRWAYGPDGDRIEVGGTEYQFSQDQDYAKNFTADNLFGFSTEDIRGSARGNDFEISDQQVDDYFAAMPQATQDHWNNYRPKAGAFDDLRKKHGLGGSNPLWDYENDSLDRRAVMRQGLRNNLAQHENNDTRLRFGLGSLFG